MELYEKDGKIGVLVSLGYGAGWSTWGDRELAYDKRIVEFWLSHKDDTFFMSEVCIDGSAAHKEASRFFCSIGYKRCPYMGGFEDIELQFVPRGIPWRILSYDGNEQLETFDTAGFITF